MRAMALLCALTSIGAVAGFFLVSAGQLLGAAMGGGAGLVLALIVLAFPRDRDYPREQDDTFF